MWWKHDLWKFDKTCPRTANISCSASFRSRTVKQVSCSLLNEFATSLWAFLFEVLGLPQLLLLLCNLPSLYKQLSTHWPGERPIQQSNGQSKFKSLFQLMFNYLYKVKRVQQERLRKLFRISDSLVARKLSWDAGFWHSDVLQNRHLKSGFPCHQ